MNLKMLKNMREILFFFNAFQILGQTAAQSFMGNPDVQRSMNEFSELIDIKKLDYLSK